jgi:hypothetical protein
MEEQRPELIRYDLGGWISGSCDDPDPDAVELEALREEFGDRWTISLTPSRRWEATPKPIAYEVVSALSAAELREKLLRHEREHRT